MKIRLSTIFIFIIIVLGAILISQRIFPIAEPFETAPYKRKRPEGTIEVYADPNMTEDEIRILKKINQVGNQLVADAEYDNVDTSYLEGKQLSPPSAELSQVSII